MVTTTTTPRPCAHAVPFEVLAPGALHVEVTGDFTGWVQYGLQLSRLSIDRWKTSLILEPGEYQYRLLINGEWKDHAEATRRVRNPYGTENCVLKVT